MPGLTYDTCSDIYCRRDCAEKQISMVPVCMAFQLMATSIFLFIYKESNGAYDEPNAHQQMNHRHI